MPGPHAITVRRQVVDAVVCGSERDGLTVQRHLSRSVEAVVVRALKQALEEVVPADDHLVVDRLEIELVDVPLAGLDDTLEEEVRRQAAAFFRRHTPAQPVRLSTARSPDGPVVRQTGAASVEDAFVMFLRTGHLPWSFTVADGTDLETTVRDALESEGGDGPEPVALRRERVRDALDDPVARLRVVKQLTERFVDWLVDRLAPDVATAMAAALEPAEIEGPVWSAFSRHVRLAALLAVAERRTTTAQALVSHALAEVPTRVRDDRRLIRHVVPRWPEVRLHVTIPRGSDVSDPTEDAHRPDEAVPLADDPAALTREPAERSTSCLVDHAGLVLLHPFLPRFLEGLGVAAGERLVDTDRAVALLHHLATGDVVVPEQATTVAKVLCGCPLEQPVDREPGLTRAEIAEASALLRAAIAHWEALRSTSPDALRAEFLTRPGVLSTEGDGDWVLRVEQRPVDILLEQLPWGVSMGRTPWMRRMLRVEWRA
jgi:hypothetical protein